MIDESPDVPADGCAYRESDRAAACRKLCDPGHHYCPFHELLAAAEEEAREDRKNRPHAAKNGRAAKRRLRSAFTPR